jgi:hypothetical protein
MKKAAKIIGIVVIIMVVAMGLFIMINWSDLKNFRPMAGNVYSKFMCSCLFVEGRTEEQCRNWSRVAIPVSAYKVDYKEKRVTATGLGLTGTSSYRGERFGCVLE